MSIELGENGRPPQGRRRATLEDVRTRFVDHPDFAESPIRQKIWADFERATAMLRSVIPICAMWIGGSFVTTKPDPSDIDVIYIVAASDYRQLQGKEARKRVAVFSENGALMDRGVRVDCSILVWDAIPVPSPDHPGHVDYLKWRGYWDDFLQRHVENKAAAATIDNAIPARGYLEVTDNDFTAG